jgi:hemerythrin-like metal-binding protein
VQPLRWTTDDYVYVPQLDADHQKVFEDAENVRQAVVLGRPSSQVGFQLWRLSKSFSTHLGSEERLMRNTRYPGFQWHERQHHAGRTKMAALTQAVHRDDEIGIRDGIEDLMRWLRDHIHLADRMFAAHLRNDQRERMAS